MTNKNKLNSGNHCINIQAHNFKYMNTLPREELKAFRDEVIQTLLEQFKKEEQIGEILWSYKDQSEITEDTIERDYLNPKQLIGLIKKWKPNLIKFQKSAIIETIFSEGLALIYRNAELSTFIQNDMDCHPTIKQAIIPACKLSTGQNIKSIELKQLIQSLLIDDITQDYCLSIHQQGYLIKVIYSILYNHESSINDADLSEVLKDLPVTNNVFLSQFFVDVFFRIKSKYLFVENSLYEVIKEQAEYYFICNPEKPLTYLKRIILDPVEIYKQYEFETIIADLSKIALLCSNTIEARWVVTALFRVLPLFKTMDIDKDYEEAKDRIVSHFDPKLIQNFNFLKFLELKNCLSLFQKNSEPSQLIKYESLFVKAYEQFHLDQQIALQIEYASTLYMFLINNEIEIIENSKFANYVLFEEQHVVEKPVFSNFLVIDDKKLEFFPNNKNKGLLLKWLYMYIDRVYRLYIQKKLALNPFLLFNLRTTSTVPYLKPQINAIAVRYIEDRFNNITNNPLYACKIISIIEFCKIANKFDAKSLLTCVSSALVATEYEIILNAKSISYILYHLKYYCDDVEVVEVDSAINYFVKLFVFKNTQPRLYWATIKCCSLLDQEEEKGFIISLYQSFKNANPKMFKLALNKKEEFNLVIPNKTIEAIKLHMEKNSVLAVVADDYLLVSEYWNLLATTVINLEFPNRIESLFIGSIFYSIAKCFAREQRQVDQKYSYNYIKVTSKYYDEAQIFPPEVFIRDCSFYIDRPNNQYFYFKGESCAPFFKLLKKHYSELPNYIRNLYDYQILPKRGWVKKAFKELRIGIFSEKIKIK